MASNMELVFTQQPEMSKDVVFGKKEREYHGKIQIL